MIRLIGRRHYQNVLFKLPKTNIQTSGFNRWETVLFLHDKVSNAINNNEKIKEEKSLIESNTTRNFLYI